MTAGGGWSRTDYIGGLRPSRSKARAWRSVGSVGRSKRYFGLLGRLTLLRARVARSARRLRKLWTGIPSSVRREVALRMAAGERLAGATMDCRSAAAAGRSWSSNRMGAKRRRMWNSSLRLRWRVQSQCAPLLGPDHRQVGQALGAEPARKATLHRVFDRRRR